MSNQWFCVLWQTEVMCVNCDECLTNGYVSWQRLWVPMLSLPFPGQHARLELQRRSVAFGQANVVVSFGAEQSVMLQNKGVEK